MTKIRTLRFAHSDLKFGACLGFACLPPAFRQGQGICDLGFHKQSSVFESLNCRPSA
jgi:hypothetical protein